MTETKYPIVIRTSDTANNYKEQKHSVHNTSNREKPYHIFIIKDITPTALTLHEFTLHDLARAMNALLYLTIT